jgi:hypothetical protein
LIKDAYIIIKFNTPNFNFRFHEIGGDGLTTLHLVKALIKLMGCSSPLEGEQAKMF